MSVVNATPMLLGDEGYQISRSVRLRSSASASFSRTPASAGNRKTWTWSGWIKLGALTSGFSFITQYTDGNNQSQARIRADGTLRFYDLVGGAFTTDIYWTPVYRDPSAWYHVMLVADTTQATNTNRIKFYVNGLQVTSTSSATWPTQNTDLRVNLNAAHFLGQNGAGGEYADGYLTEINFIDGQALTPSSFGETDAITGVWKPKRYTGTYGTNGFYLNFSDNSNNTAATIGKDYSGNGNNWTPNNISVTSGVTYDSMLDVPTPYADGGNGRGNYAVMNPLDYVAAAFSGTASNGNLTVSIPAPTNSNGIASSIKVVSTAQPKFYIESTITSLSTACSFGMISGTNANYRLRHTADITLAVNDVVMTAFDPATGNIWYGRNGTWLSSGNPSAGTNPFYTIPSTEIVGSVYCVLASNGSTGTFTTNTTFGQQPFTYTPPTGFKALNTQNLPDSTIKKGNAYFDATTYTGTGASQSIVNSGGMQPDFVWTKSRSGAYDHFLLDSVRGGAALLISNATSAEFTGTTYISSFASNGFTIANTSSTGINANGSTYVGWQWKESASAGFDIVTYTGNGANRTIAHNLGVAPTFMIVRNRQVVGQWAIYHQALGNTNTIYLNLTNSVASQPTFWNSTSPTSSVFSLGTDSTVNGNGNNHVAYLFAEVAGFSKFGSYTGNGSTDGPFVFCGFRPRFIMYKRTDTIGNWNMLDTTRSTFNVSQTEVVANQSIAEFVSANANVDVNANGFKLRTTDGDRNASGGTYIFAAFAENPFKNSLAR